MKTNLTSTILTASAALAITAFVILTGCAKENGAKPDSWTDLEIASVSSESSPSKTVIDGTTFPTNKGSIGLFLFKDAAATTYYGTSDTGYKNVSYSWNSTKSKWTANPSIKVGSTTGYLYGYFPYIETNTDIKAIPVTSTLNGDDVMYVSKQTVTDKTAAGTSIVMNHALARIALTVTKSDYTGEAKLTNINFTNAEGTADADKVKIASSGTLNAVDGTINATIADAVSFNVPSGEQEINADTGTTYECLLVPSAPVDTRQTVILTLKIDSDDKSIELSGDNGVIIKSGVKSTISITLSNTGLAVSSVSITDWGTGTVHEGTIGGDI
mgnify:CR=1 FL=1